MGGELDGGAGRMSAPSTAREALLAEAIGDVAGLLQQIEALKPALTEICQVLEQASTTLADDLAGFQRQVAVITENAKVQAVRHMATRTDEATRRAIEAQSRAMADTARAAFAAELGTSIQHLQATLQALRERPNRSWEDWLLHLSIAVTSSVATWALVLFARPR